MTTFDPVWQDIKRLFQQFGGAQYTLSEPITQTAHALQTFYWLQHHGWPESLQVAGLLHDVGHFLVPGGPVDPIEGRDDHHAEVGANWLQSIGFPASVTGPIRQHVAAKRYRVWRQPHRILSRGSTLSLALQGGPMTAEEARAFERHPYFWTAMILREADDGGKDLQLQTRQLDEARETVARVFSDWK